MFGRHHEIPLVFTVLVVDQDDHPAKTQVLQGGLDGCERDLVGEIPYQRSSSATAYPERSSRSIVTPLERSTTPPPPAM